jgi:ABC-type multidrug transport system fused ATPase/permease subunit
MFQKIKNILISLYDLWGAFEHRKRDAILLLFMLVIVSLLEALSIGFLLPVMEVIIEGKTDNDFAGRLLSMSSNLTQEKTLTIVLAVFFLLIVMKNIFVYLKNKVGASLLFGLRGYWMNELMSKYLESNYNFIVNSKQGTLINNVLVETEKAQLCLKFLVQFLSATLLSTFMLAVLFFISWQVTMVMLLVAVLFSFLSHNLIGVYSRKVGAEKLKYAKFIGNQVSESIIAIKQVKTLGMEGRILNSFSEIVGKYVKTLSGFRVNSGLPQIIGEVFVVFMLVATVLYIISYTDSDIKGLVPMVAVFVIVGNRISVQAALLANSSMHILSNIASLRNIYDLVKDDVGRENLKKGSRFEGLNRDVIFNDVSFSYGEGYKVFERLNFIIPKGKFVFLIGDSGSGKSTLVDLLLRLQKPQSGSIIVGDSDLSKINIKSWRNAIGYVSQDIMLFNKSIKENIRDGKYGATDEEIKSICKKVNASDFIQHLPEGYETNVGDRGAKLSGGQSQRLVLARSMLHDPDFLIFDEATSAMDQKLEEKIIQEIKLNFSGKTVLFITHRLTTAIHADVIYRLDKGKITTVSKTALN